MWAKSYAGSEYGPGQSAIEVSDGYVIAGAVNQMLVKINKNGDLVWAKEIDDDNRIDSPLRSLSQIGTDGFMAVGDYAGAYPLEMKLDSAFGIEGCERLLDVSGMSVLDEFTGLETVDTAFDVMESLGSWTWEGELEVQDASAAFVEECLCHTEGC